MDKAPAYGAGDSGFESQYGLYFFLFKKKKNLVYKDVKKCSIRGSNP
jgi:hypothetical protein